MSFISSDEHCDLKTEFRNIVFHMLQPWTGLGNVFYTLQNLQKLTEKHGATQNYSQPHESLRSRVFSELFSKIYFSTFWKLENARLPYFIKKHKKFIMR